MTEELKQKARQKALEWNDEKINGKYNRPPIANWACYEKGYIAGATEATKELQDKLAKAKKIIHRVCYEFGIYDKDFMEKARQFLKE